jgi:hypothetical protein
VSETWDPAHTTGTTPGQMVYSVNLNRWYPLIQGGAGTEGDPDPDGDDPPGDDDQDPDVEDNDDESTGEDERKFSQKEVNAIVTREAQKAARGKLDPKELGFKDGKELKTFLETMKTKQEEEKTEAEKAHEQAIADAVQTARDEVLSTANQRLVRAEFLVAAAEAGIDKTARGDAFLLAQTMESWAQIEVDEEGKVSGFDEAFFTELKEAKPFLFAKEEEEDESERDLGGGRPRGKGKGNDKTADMVQKYPALSGPATWGQRQG